MQRIWLRLRTLIGRKRAADQLDDEIQFHLEQQIAENVAAGMGEEEARYAAMRHFGNTTVLKEETRNTWGWITLEQIAQDLRYGFRGLRKSPLFTVVAVLTLAFGIGANTAIFTLMDQVLLQLLSVKHPEQLVLVTERGIRFGSSWGDNDISYPMYRDNYNDHASANVRSKPATSTESRLKPIQHRRDAPFGPTNPDLGGSRDPWSLDSLAVRTEGDSGGGSGSLVLRSIVRTLRRR